MMVKICTDAFASIASKGERKRTWVYFDGFRKIKQFEVKISLLERIKADYWVINPDYPKDELGIEIICTRRDNNNEYVIATTEPTYLLNDEGKTIERIN